MPSKTTKAAPKGVSLDLEPQVLESIDQLIPAIEDTVAVKEFGIKVTRETVARIALLRGLDLMQNAQDCAMPSPALTAPPEPTASAESAPEAVTAPLESEVPRNVDGTIRTPEGWRRWGKNETLPDAQALLHDYYTRNGWHRYWGRAGEEIITFYWSCKEDFQDLDIYDGTDANGKTLLLRETPYGPGHMIPHGWTL